jgi:N-acetylneuraminic acid mutarotase
LANQQKSNPKKIYKGVTPEELYMIKGSAINKHLAFIITCLVLLTTITYIIPQRSEADEVGTIRVLSAKLPTPRYRTAAIWDGENAYVFCGDTLDELNLPIPLDEIIKFAPETENVQNLSVSLPIRGGGVSAIWDGNDAYIFGGESWDRVNGWQAYDEIIRYNPNSNTTENMAFMKLPSERFATSAIYDGEHFYIFGGLTENFESEIIRCNLTSYDVDIMPTRLPNHTSYTSAIWDGENVYIFGGEGQMGIGHIIQYDPQTDSVNIMNSTLPTERSRRRTSAIWDGNYAYIFGGVSWLDGGWIYSRDILRYDTKNDELKVMPSKLPTGREGTSAVWTGEKVYIFGGYEGKGTLTDQIVEYIPPKAADSDSTNDSQTEGTDLLLCGSFIIILIAITAIIVYVNKKQEDKTK